jgi:molybdenum-dependent DNA-binding transcriptional regulator ModE
LYLSGVQPFFLHLKPTHPDIYHRKIRCEKYDLTDTITKYIVLNDDKKIMKPADHNLTRRLDLTSLQLFVAVCELGSIGKAAQREFIAPSALSKRLSDLEATLGSPLVHRHSRGVHLTPAGQSLLHHARSVLFSLERMHTELGEYADGARGQVRVHASISATVQFLPEDLGAFICKHPDIKIDFGRAPEH